jgi:SP family general alpha glucoside:H+ symporter-like MFS transporter
MISSIITPYILNPTAGNWKAEAAFLPGGLSMIILIWSYFRIPDLKGRSYEEIDHLFDRGYLHVSLEIIS